MSAIRFVRGKYLGTAALVTGAAFCVSVLWNLQYLVFEHAVRNATGGHLDDLSIIAEYLSPPLSKGDYARLWERASAVERSIERNGVSNRPDEYVGLLESADLEKACASAEAERSAWLRTLCEWKRISNSGKSPVECSPFTDSEARAECRRSNDAKFSIESRSHCSKADCLVNNAVFKTVVSGGSVCEELPPSITGSCKNILDSYLRYSADPNSFEKPELENALLGKTADETWLAARAAVLDNPDSPSDECRKFSGGTLTECERKTKSLFSYVQLRGLKNRLKAISEAVMEYRKNHEKP